MNSPTPEPRYAIYFVPAEDTALYRFGAAVLGYDAYSGQPRDFIDGVDAPAWRELVHEPHVYGFHATLKAPFYLAKGTTEDDVGRVLDDVAASQPAVLVGELVLRELGSFIALVPASPRPLLDRLAQTCVRDFDRFRAPMSEQERARRLVPALSDRQIENLVRWGYPYVFEDFRFHMTLTGKLALQKRSKAFRFLCGKFEQLSDATALTVDQIVVAKQDHKASPFQILKVAPLGQSPYRPFAYSC
jgi:putative phosphonate metabolism protein